MSIRKVITDDNPTFDSDSSAQPMVLSLFMVGKSKDRSAPTIVLTCADERLRRHSYELVKKSQVMSRCRELGFGLIELSMDVAGGLVELLGKGWGLYKEEIITLYGKHKLDDVRAIMKAKRGFDAS